LGTVFAFIPIIISKFASYLQSITVKQDIIDNARQEVVVYVNKHSDLMFWHIGHYINEDVASFSGADCMSIQPECDAYSG